MTENDDPTERLPVGSMFVQDANGTVVELVPVPGLWWDPEDRYGIDADGRSYSRPERLQANHQPLYRVVYRHRGDEDR